MGFERWVLVEKILSQVGVLGRIVGTRVLDDAFTHFESEIQSSKGSVALLEIFHNAQRVQVVIEK